MNFVVGFFQFKYSIYMLSSSSWQKFGEKHKKKNGILTTEAYVMQMCKTAAHLSTSSCAILMCIFQVLHSVWPQSKHTVLHFTDGHRMFVCERELDSCFNVEKRIFLTGTQNNTSQSVSAPITPLHYAALSPAKQLPCSQSPVEEKRVTGCPKYLQDGDSVLS